MMYKSMSGCQSCWKGCSWNKIHCKKLLSL